MRLLLFIVSQVLVVSVIFGLSSIPGASFGAPTFNFTGLDKIVHACIYCGYAIVTSFGLSMFLKKSSVVMGVTLCSSVLLGIGDEFYQQHIPGRDSSVYDCVADIIGAAIGAYVVYRILRKKK